MALPVFIRVGIVEHLIHIADGHGEHTVIQQVPQRRVSDVLLTLDPDLGPHADPGGHGHDERVDPALPPLVQVLPLVLPDGVGQVHPLLLVEQGLVRADQHALDKRLVDHLAQRLEPFAAVRQHGPHPQLIVRLHMARGIPLHDVVAALSQPLHDIVYGALDRRVRLDTAVVHDVTDAQALLLLDLFVEPPAPGEGQDRRVRGPGLQTRIRLHEQLHRAETVAHGPRDGPDDVLLVARGLSIRHAAHARTQAVQALQGRGDAYAPANVRAYAEHTAPGADERALATGTAPGNELPAQRVDALPPHVVVAVAHHEALRDVGFAVHYGSQGAVLLDGEFVVGCGPADVADPADCRVVAADLVRVFEAEGDAMSDETKSSLAIGKEGR